MNDNMKSELAVLDTNICLDLFVFHDALSADLLKAIEEHNLIAITREDCRCEWLRVLDYPKLALDDTEKTRSRQAFDRYIRIIDPEKRDYRTLPVCRDKDDQKFMELAYDAHASCLITKDKALLKLAGKNRKNGYFAIITPDQWIAGKHRSAISA